MAAWVPIVQRDFEMNFAKRLRLCWYAATMILAGSSACASRPQGTGSLSAQQVPLVRADSEVFEAVVRAQLAATKKDYPFHLDGLRYDSRPSTPIVAFRITARPTRRADTSGLFQTPDAATLSRLTASRRQILERAGVEEGGPFPETNCAGVLVPPPPPPPPGSPTSARTSQPDIHAGCPRRDQNYLTVSLPVRGQPKSLIDTVGPGRHTPKLKGEVWTVVVEEASAGPGGSMWSQHVWLFTRNPSNGRLQLADTVLLAIIE